MKANWRIRMPKWMMKGTLEGIPEFGSDEQGRADERQFKLDMARWRELGQPKCTKRSKPMPCMKHDPARSDG